MITNLLEQKELAPIFGAAVGAIATLLAVLCTGTLNILLARMNLKSQRSQKMHELNLEKLEELYAVFQKWEVALSGIYLMHLRNYYGKLTYAQVLELVRDNRAPEPGEGHRHKMLIEVYFPELTETYKAVEEARSKTVPFLEDAKKTNLSVKDFIACQEAFESACKHFKKAIAAQAHKRLS